MKLKIDKGGTELQTEALRLKMEALGLEVDQDREIRPESIARFPGGAQALEAVADKRGRLDLAALEKLSKGTSAESNSARAALHLRSITLAVEGTTSALASLSAEADKIADPKNVAAIARRVAHLIETLSQVTETHREDLLAGPAENIDKLSIAVGELSKACSTYLRAAGKVRSAILSKVTRAPGDAALSASLVSASGQLVDALLKVSDMAALRQIRSTFRHCLSVQLESNQRAVGEALVHALVRTEAIFSTTLSNKDVEAILAGSLEGLDRSVLVRLREIVQSGEDWRDGAVPSTHEYMREALKEPLSLDLASFDRELSQQAANAEAIVGLFERVKPFASLFSEWSGVHEGYSIRAHNLRVFETFAEHSGPWGIDQLETNGIRLRRLFLALLPLHDVGKPVAIEEGNKDRQHEFTVPILCRTLEALGFSRRETQLARLLVDNDIFGDVVKQDAMKKKDDGSDKKKIDSDRVVSEITKMANKAGLDPKTFFELQLFFYTVDASSYPGLKKRVFEQAQSRLLPKSETLWESYARLGGQKPA